MPKTYRVAVIGRTGRGNYGHGLDMVWKSMDNVEIVRQPHVPLLLIHGVQDDVVAYHHAEDVFDQAVEPKRLVSLKHTDHSVPNPQDAFAFKRAIAEFVSSLA